MRRSRFIVLVLGLAAALVVAGLAVVLVPTLFPAPPPPEPKSKLLNSKYLNKLKRDAPQFLQRLPTPGK